MRNIASHYRQATPQEVNFYQHRLYPLQDKIFSFCSAYQDLYLTGGTALGRYYFQHRWSDDVDLFIRIHKTDSDELINFEKRADFFAKDLAGKLGRSFVISREMYGEYYARFFVSVADVELKIDFVREYNHFGELNPTPDGCLINNLEDIGASKIAAFEDRAAIKDIIDLYYLSQHISWARLFELADTKRVPVAYENLLTFNIEGITGQALITKPLPPEKLSAFIDKLKQEVVAEVKKKERLMTDTLNNWLPGLLWDFPRERRTINEYSVPVLRQRLKKLPLPEKMALQKALIDVPVQYLPM